MSATKLRSLSDSSLLSRLHALIRRERAATLDVLQHLNEVERRKLHLKHGYRSLFAYCTGCLGYSESAAGRRIQTARCIRRYPQLARHLLHGEVHLSTVCKVARTVLSGDEPGLIERIRGKSLREVDVIVAEFDPVKRPRDRVKPVRIAPHAGKRSPSPAPLGSRVPAGNPHTERSVQPRREAGAEHSRCGSVPTSAGSTQPREGRKPSHRPHSTSPAGGSGTASPASDANKDTTTAERGYKVEFVASEGLMRTLEQVRLLLSFHLPAGAPMEDVLAVVFEEFIERHSPERRRVRRETRRAKRTARAGRATRTTRAGNAGSAGATKGTDGTGHGDPAVPGETVSGEATGSGKRRSIPVDVRDEVLARDGHRCTYIGAGGKRCDGTRHLEIDHIRPVALGGGNEPDNLRVLCTAHNMLEAERVLGASTMTRYARRE